MEISLMMDNDSGYVSHNTESNLDSSSENAYINKTKLCSTTTSDVYLSEDALLEKPICKRFDSFDSVINSSQDSVKTEFSGFDDSDRSDNSFVIPEAKPIVWNSHECKENISPSGSSPSVVIETPTKSSKPMKVLANVTNTYCSKTNSQSSGTPQKPYVNQVNPDVSPDLFSEEEQEENELNTSKNKMKKDTPKINYCSKDTKLLKNVQNSLNGVHPPPSVTIIQMTVNEMLEKLETNKKFFWKTSSATGESQSLIINNNEECLKMEWPDILKARYHGLHYNRNKTSEDLEHLCLKYAERYVGVETQSSCTIFESNPSSSQKRSRLTKPRWVAKSPGRRLSHLARRRITFSSSNLQASSSSAILGSRARQILVDARKLSMSKKSPKKTPSKSPFKVRKNTPSSSAKKKLAMRFREMSGEFESTSSSLTFKRALFSNEPSTSSSSSSLMEKKSTKRALFASPLKNSPKKSPFKIGLDKKRKRNDVDDSNPTTKFPRSISLDFHQPTKNLESKLNRTLSDNFHSKPEELSEQHKKKLQWAVYESLRLQNVTPAHPQYKVFASVLARVTRKFLPNLRMEGRTTEKMFRVARHHSYAVVKGKTVDEIVNEYMRNRLKNQKPQGYVALEEFNKENISENFDKRTSRFLNQNRIDRIKKVISFEDKES